MHALKYMSRPWSHEDFEAVQDDNLKNLLVLDLSGFQYLRFWGALSNCRYKDEMDLSEIKTECESKVDEKLIMRFISPFNYDGWKSQLEEIEEGFYRLRLRRKGLKNEREKLQENETQSN